MKKPLNWLRAKKWRLVYSSVLSLFILGAFFAFFQAGRFLPVLGVTVYKAEAKKKEEAAKLFVSPLSGALVSEDTAKRRPVGLMIENASFGARPQSGLDRADVVIEALAEGGITRFYSVFQSKDAEEIGPVRSARPYYVSWAAGFKAAYTHIGQSPEAQDLLKGLGDGVVPDINFGFRFNSGYTRVKFRAAPHNVYTTTGDVRSLLDRIGQNAKADWPGFAFKDDLDLSLRPDAGVNPSVDFRANAGLYKANYIYDKAANSYKRVLGGVAHTDKVTGAQLTAKNIIVIFLPNNTLYPSGHGRLNVNTLGKGEALLFRDGKVIPATWSKPGHADPLAVTQKDGHEAILNRGGTTWVDMVFPYSKVTY